MKTKYEAYTIGSEVYGCAGYHKGNDEPVTHFGIYKAIVRDVCISHDNHGNIEMNYMLATPGGEDWGDSVEEKFVHDEFTSLFSVLQEIWDKDPDYK